jgi:hypothetical protein
MKWEVKINAGATYMSFADSFVSDDLYLHHEHDEHTGHVFYATSKHLESIDTYQEAIDRSFSLLLLLNGAENISNRRVNSYPISFDGVSLEGGSCQSDVRNIDEYPFDPHLQQDKKRSVAVRRCLSSHLLYAAKSDDSVRSMLFLSGLLSTHNINESIHSWSLLYRIMETSEYLADVVGHEIDKNRCKGFTAACNNMSVLGLNARHGQTKNTGAPKSTITDFDEAASLVLGLAREVACVYLSQRYSSSATV